MKSYERNQAVLTRALEALRKIVGITGNVTKLEFPITYNRRADAHLEIEADGVRYDYVAEIKRVDRFVFLADIKNKMAMLADKALLIAPRITNELADKCRELDLQFLDASGNAYLRRPGLLVFVKGMRPADKDDQLPEEEGRRVGTATHLRVQFALLCKQRLLNATYREINEIANVALGTIGWVFTDLNQRGYTTGGKGKANRVFLERQKLILEWVMNYPIKLRTKLNSKRFRAPIKGWWETVDVTRYGAQWGGEVAAEKLTGYLRAHAVTIYFHKENKQKNLTRFVIENRLQADPQGDIEVLDAFWDFADEVVTPETAPPILVYADLLATLNPRNLETAKLIYDQYIANAQNEG